MSKAKTKTTGIEWTHDRVTLGELEPWEHNPRYSTKRQARAMLASWDELGQFQTIAVGPASSGKSPVYDGHQRLSAMIVANGPSFRIDIMRSNRPLTDDERRRLVLAAHAGATGSWNWDALAGWDGAELIAGGLDGEYLSGLQADVAALAALLEAEKPAPVEDVEPAIDRAEELRVRWGVESGQMWQLGEHRLICGDCTDRAVVERVMGGERADAVVTDPPYGIGVDKSMHENGGQQYGNAAAPKRHYADTNWDVKPDKDTIDFVLSLAPVSVVWGGNYFELPPTRCVLVWDKENGGNQFADCELAWTNLDKPVRIIRHMWNGMLRAGREERTPHPTQKPIGVMVWAVEQTGDNCVVVIDPFSGSGTTLIACERLGRKCRAIEISPAYVAVALERWSVATGKTPELVDTERLSD